MPQSDLLNRIYQSKVKHASRLNRLQTYAGQTRAKLFANNNISIYTLPVKKPRPPKPTKNRSYCLNWKKYRQIASQLQVMWHKKKNMLTFWTFTLPFPLGEKYSNKAFSMLLENLTKNYGLNKYLWVLEYQKSGRPHYHAVLDMPFQDIQKIKSAWHHALFTAVKSAYMRSEKEEDLTGFLDELREYLNAVSNSVRLPEKKEGKKYRSEITSLDGLTKYLCKYMAKEVRSGQRYESKCYAVSRNMSGYCITLDVETFEEVLNQFETVRITELSELFYLKDFEYSDFLSIVAYMLNPKPI